MEFVWLSNLTLIKLKDKVFHQRFHPSLATKLKSNAQPQIKDMGLEIFWEAVKNNVKTMAKDILETKSDKGMVDEECKII